MKRSNFIADIALYWGMSTAVSLALWALPALIVAGVIYALFDTSLLATWLACWAALAAAWLLGPDIAQIVRRRLRRRA